MTEITRFYNTFHPEHYDLYIDVNRKNKTINGVSTIHGEAMQADVSVHQKYMKIANVTANGKEVPFKVDNNNDAINIKLANAGDTTLKITYSAPLTDTMMGIYPSYYEVDGVKKELIGTQFETTFARQAFPSIDEPEAKATFSLALKFDEHEGETALANMPEDHVKDGVHYFQETVRMSTYLVAFAFGELQSKLTETKSGIKVGVFSTKAHKPKELDFALDIAKRAIEFYEDYYQTPYPLPHSWQLALPDFSAGAMENWGLITYREAYMLIDPDNTSLDTKQLVATVIAHELAHQWFGDLVTMRWWDDLWLNESFANMMEYVSTNAIEPNWHIWEMFQTSDVPSALQRDAIDGVQPVHVQVNNPAEIDSLFDPAIVYAKGARMLVMVRALMGDDALRKGLKYYFSQHKYGNATGNDLWDALSTATDLDIGKIMKTWLEQPGYPVVSASVIDGKLVLSQKQFFIGDGKQVGRKWDIPLSSNYDAAPRIMGEESITIGDYAKLRQENGKPFRLNVGNNSHFIVKYDKTLMDDILVNEQELNNIDHLQLLQDLRLLADGNQVSYATLIPLLDRFANSHSKIVNAALYRVFNNLKNFVVEGSPEEEQLRSFANKLSADQVKRLGYLPSANDQEDDELTRPYVIAASLYAKNANTIKELHKIYQDYSTKLDSLSADVRALVLQNEILNFNTAELFTSLIKQYQKTSDPSFKQDIVAAVTRTKDADQIKQIISYYEDASIIKPQDLRAWYRGVLANPAGQQAAWNWLRDDWDWLNKTVGGDMEFATYITVTSAIFHTPERLTEFKAFFEPKINTPGLTREIKMDISIISSRVALIEAEKAAVNTAVSEALK